MKKYIFSLVLLVVGIFLTGCGSKLVDENGSERSEYGINEYAKYKDIGYRVTKVEHLYEDGYGYKLEDKDNNFILAVTYEIKNDSKEKYPVNKVEALLKVDGSDINSHTYVRNPEDISQRAFLIDSGEVFSETDYYEISKDYKDLKYKLIIDDEKEIEMKVNLEE